MTMFPPPSNAPCPATISTEPPTDVELLPACAKTFPAKPSIVLPTESSKSPLVD